MRRCLPDAPTPARRLTLHAIAPSCIHAEQGGRNAPQINHATRVRARASGRWLRCHRCPRDPHAASGRKYVAELWVERREHQRLIGDSPPMIGTASGATMEEVIHKLLPAAQSQRVHRSRAPGKVHGASARAPTSAVEPPTLTTVSTLLIPSSGVTCARCRRIG